MAQERSQSSELCLQTPTLANALRGNGTVLSLSVILPLQNDVIVAPAANMSTKPDCSTDQLTLKEGLARIFARNQKNDYRPLTAWHVEMGDCGGRLGASFSTLQSTPTST